MQTRIPVFYVEAQVAPREATGHSPSATKPEAVVQSWLEAGLPIELQSFAPVTPAQLSLVHDPDYVRGVLSLREPNGFGTYSREVARALPYTSGSFVAAARHVRTHGGAAASPTSGFHHAEYESGGGYCSFNGLALAAALLVKEGAGRVGVLDLDAHHGNGLVDILRHFPSLDARVEHFTRGMAPYGYDDPDPEALISFLPGLLERWKAAGVEVLLFQAGADPHEHDPLGSGYLSTEELHRRDRAVFQACARLGLPVAWNLAGGYQEDRLKPWPQSIRKVLDIHDHTMQACVEAFVGPC